MLRLSIRYRARIEVLWSIGTSCEGGKCGAFVLLTLIGELLVDELRCNRGYSDSIIESDSRSGVIKGDGGGGDCGDGVVGEISLPAGGENSMLCAFYFFTRH